MTDERELSPEELAFVKNPFPGIPRRAAVLCTFRVVHYARPGGVVLRRELEPLSVVLSCGHNIKPGRRRRRYRRGEWPCGACAHLFPRAIIDATRKREAARHAAAQCGPSCSLCFAALGDGGPL
jgi:hypothetical protein